MPCDVPPNRRSLYRSRNGMVFGICRGMAQHFDLPVFWLRALAVVAFFMTGFWPAGLAYLAAAFMIKQEPVLPLDSAEEAEFYHSYASARGLALQRLKCTFDTLDRRIQRMEGVVTSPEFDWDRRLNESHR